MPAVLAIAWAGAPSAPGGDRTVKPDLDPSRDHDQRRRIERPPLRAGRVKSPLLPALAGYDNPELIAHGATALVFRATQTRLNRLVAIKVITMDAVSMPVNVERELATTVALSSQPHIVSIIDTGVTDDAHPYFVMEYCEGGSYLQILRDGGPMPVDDVIEVGIKIGEALHAAHQAGIIHRDVKPSNILRSRFGPALTDFGIARAPDELGGTVTREMMTPYYASPEALLQQTQSGLSDVYSLAATMWTLLVGHPPFGKPTGQPIDMGRFVDRVLHDPLPPMSSEDAPTWLVSELTRAMSKLPSQRQANALEFAEALRRGAFGRAPAAITSAHTARPTTSQRSFVPIQRDQVHLASTLPQLVSDTAGITMAMPPPSPPARRRRLLVVTGLAVATFLAGGLTMYQLKDEHRTATPETSSPSPSPAISETPSTAATTPAGATTARPTSAKPATTSAGPVRNLAIGKAMTASGYADVHPPRNAADGDVESYWESTNNAFPQWLEVDLGTATRVGRLVLTLPRSPLWLQRTQGIQVVAGNGSSTWTVVNWADYSFDPSRGNLVTITFAGTTARTLRLNFRSNSAWPAGQISEFEVFAQ
jgi:serine/threonine protein kinase